MPVEPAGGHMQGAFLAGPIQGAGGCPWAAAWGWTWGKGTVRAVGLALPESPESWRGQLCGRWMGGESGQAWAEAIQGSQGQGGRVGAEGWGPIPEAGRNMFSFELGGLPESLGEWPRAVGSWAAPRRAWLEPGREGEGQPLGSAAQQWVTEGKGVLERASGMGGRRRAGRGPQAQRQVSLMWVDVA